MTEWGLVGRSEELRRLAHLVVPANRGGAVLAGPPGVGKTRLAVECLRLAEQAGAVTARVTASRSAAELPFGALAPLLGEDAALAESVDDRADLLRRWGSALTKRARGARLVLMVDDAHLLDSSSATLVHQLVTASDVVVVATVLRGSLPPDSVVSMWKEGLVERIDIGGLERDAIAELLPAIVGGPVDPATVAELADRCQGNVLFLRELVFGALDDRSLVNDGGIWRLRHPLRPSTRLVEVVEGRLGTIDDDERALLELVAYGEPLGQAELARLADADLAEQLERRALLSSRLNGRRLEVRLAHPLYGDVIRAQTPALRQRRIARSLAEVIESMGSRRRDDAMRVAIWHLAAGMTEPDVFLAGARSARWRYDFPLAERLARAAVAAGGSLDAALLTAELVGLQGRTEDAERELAHLAERATDDAWKGRIAAARFDNLATRPEAFRILDEAERTIQDQGWRDELAARRLSQLGATHGPRESVAAAEPLLARATGSALARACIAAVPHLARVGRIQAALDTAAMGLAAQRSVSTPVAWYPWWHAVTRSQALQWAGRFDEASEIVEEQYQLAVADRSTEAQAAFAMVSVMAVGERGRVRTAVRRAREALALHRQLGRPLLMRIDQLYATLALALGGETAQAEEELAALDALAASSGWATSGWFEGARLEVTAWVTAASGDVAAARKVLGRAVEHGRALGDLVGEASALHSLARLGSAKAVHRRLTDVADLMEGELAPARAAHASALAQRDAIGLDKVSNTFEAIGADLLAAEAAADAAVVRRRAGELREAASAERRASALVERCEGPITPALQGIEVRERLTPAERDTALLAAAGRSNPEIAETLCLSRRTVENRLHRVYEKLGIHGRDELAEALRPE